MSRIRARVRELIANRRQARRHRAQRKVSLIAGIAFRGELLTGRTRDMSETGLCLSLPVDNERQRELLAVDLAAHIMLVLPAKTVGMRATIIRSQPLAASDPNKGMLVGVQITHMAADDEAIYKEYLNSL